MIAVSARRLEEAFLLLPAGVTLLLLIGAVILESPLLALVPFAGAVLWTMAAAPATVPFVFIISFYVGMPLLNRGMIGIFPTHLVFLLLAAAYLPQLMRDGGRVPRLSSVSRRIVLWLGLFMTWSLLSLATRFPLLKLQSIVEGFWYCLNFGLLIGAVWLFSDRRWRELREPIINLILALSLFETGIALSQYLLAGSSSAVGALGSIVKGTFPLHHCMLGNMMVPAVALWLYKTLTVRGRVSRMFCAAGALLSLYTVVISSSRSTMVGLAGAVGLFLLLRFRFRWTYMLSVVVIAALGSGLFLMTPLRHIADQTITPSATGVDLSSYGRILVWQGAIGHFLNAPFLEKIAGVGIGTFGTVRFDVLINASNYISGAHNNLLHVLMETGVVGLFLFCALFLVLLGALYRRGRHDPLALLFFYATVALLLSGLTQETFWFQPTFGPFWLFHLVLCVLILESGRSPEASPAHATS